MGDLSERRPQRWRVLRSVAERLGVPWAEAEAAANEAAAKGWLTIEGGHSVCPTDDRRQLKAGGWMSDMLAEMPPERMLTLSDDRGTVRLQLPPMPIADLPEPLRIHLDFDAEMVDEILHRLTVLRSRMLPAPQRN
jgi:hypothetical protein